MRLSGGYSRSTGIILGVMTGAFFFFLFWLAEGWVSKDRGATIRITSQYLEIDNDCGSGVLARAQELYTGTEDGGYYNYPLRAHPCRKIRHPLDMEQYKKLLFYIEIKPIVEGGK
jgi:hypothetical protein